MPPRATSSGSPIAFRTWLAETLPEEHADPAETAIPARSKAITAVSAGRPRTAKSVVLGIRSTPVPKTLASGETAMRFRSNSFLRAAIRPAPRRW